MKNRQNEWKTFTTVKGIIASGFPDSNKQVIIGSGMTLICRTVPGLRNKATKGKYAISTHMGRVFCCLTLDEIEHVNPELANFIRQRGKQ